MGRLADRFGGARVTLAVYAGMLTVTGAQAWISTNRNYTPGPTITAAIVGYIVCLIITLFVLSGFGKGSVFKLIQPSSTRVATRWASPTMNAATGRATCREH